MKRSKLLLSLCSVLFLLSGIALAENLKIYCIDVDQGMSTLVVTPNNKAILVDCGGGGKEDAVYKIISQALKEAKDE